MQKNSDDFSVREAMRLAKTPAGQQLLAMLQQKNSDQLQTVLHLAQAGDLASASSLLQNLLSAQDAKSLMKEMEEQSHG